MLHPVLGEGIVGLRAVHKRVEEVLHVPESDADRSFLSRNEFCQYKARQKEQDYLFHSSF